MDWAVASWRERRQAQAGARLVAADIAEGDQTLLGVERSGKWNAETSITVASWDEYRAVLATHLDRDGFDAVSRSVGVLSTFNALIPERVLDKVPLGHTTKLSEKTVEGVGTTRERLAVAYNALAELGDLHKVGNRIRPRGEGALVEALMRIPSPSSGDT